MAAEKCRAQRKFWPNCSPWELEGPARTCRNQGLPGNLSQHGSTGYLLGLFPQSSVNSFCVELLAVVCNPQIGMCINVDAVVAATKSVPDLEERSFSNIFGAFGAVSHVLALSVEQELRF
jgi:hypothetical protein